MGFNTSRYEFVDVFSTEDWALEMVPQPVAAVLLLYPLTDQQIQNTPNDESTTAPAPSADVRSNGTDDVWFMKQRIGNACGTIGLIHALANLPTDVAGACGLLVGDDDGGGDDDADVSSVPGDKEGSSLEDEHGSSSMKNKKTWLQQFLRDTKSLDPVGKAERLEGDTDIAQMHDAATSSVVNATGRGEIDDEVETHFIALIESGGILYELDGRKNKPIPHGPTSRSTLLKDACQVVQKFMNRDPGEVRFAITALSPKVADGGSFSD